MFRKLALAAALAATVLGAEAAGDSQVFQFAGRRELTNNANKPTKAANHNTARKVQSFQLCLQNPPAIGDLIGGTGNTLLAQSVTSFVFNCADMANPNPSALGVVGWTCEGPASSDLLICNGELSVLTPWHKSAQFSSLAFTLWTDISAATTTTLNPVVTGVTGAWPKPESFKDLAVTTDANNQVKLNIAYKGRGWNPVA